MVSGLLVTEKVFVMVLPPGGDVFRSANRMLDTDDHQSVESDESEASSSYRINDTYVITLLILWIVVVFFAALALAMHTGWLYM